jgi:hypothetical protein
MVWIRFSIWIRIWNRNFSKVGTGTAVNRCGSTTLMEIAVIDLKHHFKEAQGIFKVILV